MTEYKSMSNQGDWAFHIQKSGYLESEQCKLWQKGGREGVLLLLKRCVRRDTINDAQHEVLFLTHENHNLWAARNEKPLITYPQDLQTARDSMIRRNRRKQGGATILTT